MFRKNKKRNETSALSVKELEIAIDLLDNALLHAPSEDAAQRYYTAGQKFRDELFALSNAN